MLRTFAFAAGLSLATALVPLLSAPAQADVTPTLSLGVGQFDQTLINPGIAFLKVSKVDPHNKAIDFRAEYRFGKSLFPSTESVAIIRPWIAAEGTSDGAAYGAGGLLADFHLGPLVFTPSFGAGLYYSGNGKYLGSPIEFRSQVELGYEFDGGTRISVAYSHISNANIADTNPGSNIIGAYLHLPISGP